MTIKEKLKVREMIMIAVFAALTAAGAFIKIQIAFVPFTLQFLFCAYAGVFLGARCAVYSQLLYLLIGLLGIPVFAQGGGLSYVLQPTFGYLLGLVLCAFFIGYFLNKNKKKAFILIFGILLGGLFLLYMCGIIYLYFILNFYFGERLFWHQVFMIGVMPYLLPDLLLCFLVAVTAKKVLSSRISLKF